MPWADLTVKTAHEPPSVDAMEDFDPAKENAFVMSSSGTTGLPKAVQLTHRNFVAMVSGRR